MCNGLLKHTKKMNNMNDGQDQASLSVDVQYVAEHKKGQEPPSAEQICVWANYAYAAVANIAKEVTIRLVDKSEMTELNRDYRGKDATTNVLSFGFDVNPAINVALLGDVVICHAVVVEEALVQKKKVNHHYAHLVTHGILHLCGYDHETESDAEQMEKLEISLLQKHGISNPYSH